MPSRADDSFLPEDTRSYERLLNQVSMPSRADDSFLRGRKFRQYSPDQIRVNALSG